MVQFIILLMMFFFHIIADYCLQGILASMKCKSWWQKNYPDYMGKNGLYRNDYIIALLEHAFFWTVMIHIPLFAYNYITNHTISFLVFIILFNITWMLHAIIDHLKANVHILNLVQDQVIHFIQIILLWVVYLFY